MAEYAKPTPEEVKFGLETHELFVNHLKRLPLWIIRRGQIEVYPYHPDRFYVITPNDLKNEHLSPNLASAIRTYKWIEDKLPDYAINTIHYSRMFHGVTEFYYQWAFEESQHSQALGFILEHTGSRTREQIEEDYYMNLQRPWIPPYPDYEYRKGLFYTLLQEALTHKSYVGLAEAANREGARATADILELIAMDEGFHFGGLRSFARLFAQKDLKGSKEDALYVASHFRMPAADLLREPWRERAAMIRGGGYAPEMLKGAITQTLAGVLEVTQPEIDLVLSSHKGRIS